MSILLNNCFCCGGEVREYNYTSSKEQVIGNGGILERNTGIKFCNADIPDKLHWYVIECENCDNKLRVLSFKSVSEAKEFAYKKWNNYKPAEEALR